MPITKAQQKAVSKYVANNYDRIEVKVPKGRKAAIEAHAKSKGISTNALVNSLLMADMGLTEAEWKQTATEPEE